MSNEPLTVRVVFAKDDVNGPKVYGWVVGEHVPTESNALIKRSADYLAAATCPACSAADESCSCVSMPQSLVLKLEDGDVTAEGDLIESMALPAELIAKLGLDGVIQPGWWTGFELRSAELPV